VVARMAAVHTNTIHERRPTRMLHEARLAYPTFSARLEVYSVVTDSKTA